MIKYNESNITSYIYVYYIYIYVSHDTHVDKQNHRNYIEHGFPQLSNYFVSYLRFSHFDLFLFDLTFLMFQIYRNPLYLPIYFVLLGPDLNPSCLIYVFIYIYIMTSYLIPSLTWLTQVDHGRKQCYFISSCLILSDLRIYVSSYLAMLEYVFPSSQQSTPCLPIFLSTHLSIASIYRSTIRLSVHLSTHRRKFRSQTSDNMER